MEYSQAEILQTVRMTEMEHLDIRTVTLGLSLLDCATDSIENTAARVREKIERVAAISSADTRRWFTRDSRATKASFSIPFPKHSLRRAACAGQSMPRLPAPESTWTQSRASGD